jgi:drug/metabolite transporter (DMT)-like permease
MIVAAALTFGLMAFVAKRVSARLPGPEVALVRFLVGAASVAVALIAGVRLRPVSLRGLFLRGFFGGTAVLFYFVAIARLSIGMATLLNYTSPIFTTVFAALFLRERVAPSTVLALATTSAGVVLVVHGNAAPGRFGFGAWEACGLASAMLSGAAVTTMRFVRRTDGTWEIFAAFCLIGAAACAPPALAAWVEPTPREWALTVAVGLLSLLAQLLFTWALRYVKAATAGVVSQLTPVTALALGVALLGEPARPLALVGSALTVVGVAWSALLSPRA